MISQGLKRQIDFGSDNLGKLLAKMSVPAIIAMVVNGLYYLVDAAFVGWGVGSSALAGLAVVFPVQMFMIAWGSMLGMGAAAVIARKLGESRKEEAGSAALHAVLLAVLSGAVFLAVTLLTCKPLLYGFGATEGTFTDARDYLQALQYGFIFVFLSMAGFNIMRAEGDAARAGMGMLLGTVINVVLDPLFIFTFNMGVGGAAWATVIARGVSTAYFLILLSGRRLAVFGTFSRNLRMKTAGTIMSLGLGNFLGQVSVSIVAVIMNTSLRCYGTDIDLAVYGVLSRMLVFITMPLLGLAQGLQPVAAFNYGSGAPGRVREVSLRALGVSTIMGILMYLLPLAAPELTMHLFTDDPLLIAAGASPLQVALCALPVLGIQILGFTLFQALGRPLRTLIVSLSRQLLFLVPLLMLLPMIWGIDGLWAAFPAADVLSVLLTLLMVRPIFSRKQMEAVAGEVR
ncbi:MAG: MATE family efflux transporter [Sediminispirochaetaceae bacterium]